MTSASLFAGGGLASVGMEAAGYRNLWAVEYDPAIAAWHSRNLPGCQMITADVCDVDYGALPTPDLLWASPSCTRASVANANRGETEEDKRAAGAVCRALRDLLPPFFFLENVTQYSEFVSFKNICAELEHLGYWYEYTNCNSADFGVPQTRRRLILRASRDTMPPPLPARRPWVGWYAAIEDLLDTLPESAFAPWQLKRLDPELVSLMTFMTNGQRTDNGDAAPTRPAREPAFSVVAAEQSGRYRAFLVDGKNIHPDGGITTRNGIEPAFAATSSMFDRPCHEPRAFILDGQANNHGAGGDARTGEDPCFTVQSSQDRRMPRAFLVSGNEMRTTPIRYSGEPSQTVLSTHPGRAWIAGGRVVRMTRGLWRASKACRTGTNCLARIL